MSYNPVSLTNDIILRDRFDQFSFSRLVSYFQLPHYFNLKKHEFWRYQAAPLGILYNQHFGNYDVKLTFGAKYNFKVSAPFLFNLSLPKVESVLSRSFGYLYFYLFKRSLILRGRCVSFWRYYSDVALKSHLNVFWFHKPHGVGHFDVDISISTLIYEDVASFSDINLINNINNQLSLMGNNGVSTSGFTRCTDRAGFAFVQAYFESKRRDIIFRKFLKHSLFKHKLPDHTKFLAYRQSIVFLSRLINFHGFNLMDLSCLFLSKLPFLDYISNRHKTIVQSIPSIWFARLFRLVSSFRRNNLLSGFRHFRRRSYTSLICSIKQKFLEFYVRVRRFCKVKGLLMSRFSRLKFNSLFSRSFRTFKQAARKSTAFSNRVPFLYRGKGFLFRFYKTGVWAKKAITFGVLTNGYWFGPIPEISKAAIVWTLHQKLRTLRRAYFLREKKKITAYFSALDTLFMLNVRKMFALIWLSRKFFENYYFDKCFFLYKYFRLLRFAKLIPFSSRPELSLNVKNFKLFSKLSFKFFVMLMRVPLYRRVGLVHVVKRNLNDLVGV